MTEENDSGLTLMLNHRELSAWVTGIAHVIVTFRDELSGHRLTPESMDLMAIKLNDTLIENLIGRSTESSPNYAIGSRRTDQKETTDA